MKSVKTHILLLAFFASLTGCQYFQFPGVHKINVQQGHILTNDMLSQLEPGMTRGQIRYLLGTPLVNDLFNDDRWDYYYSLVLGNGRAFKRSLTVFFTDDKYTHHTGENLPKAKTDAADSDNQEPETPLPTND